MNLKKNLNKINGKGFFVFINKYLGSEESQTMSSLPLSVLDVRARVLLSPALTPVQQRSTQRRGSGWRSANKTLNSG